MDCKKRKKVTTVYLPIADIICKLESENYSDIQFFSTPLFLRKPKKTAQIYLQIRETKKYLLINSLPVKINAKFRKDKIAPPLAPNLLIRSIIDINCFYFNILLFHASSFKIKKNAYVFIGQSGYGKSTIAKSTALDNLLGDDVAVIKKIKGNYYIFTSAFDFYKIERLNIILMNVSKEWSYTRMIERKRADDTPEKIQNRLSWYERDVLPSIEYFKNNNWINLADNDFERLVALADNDVKRGNKSEAVFKLFSNGIVTARDNFVIGFDEMEVYNTELDSVKIDAYKGSSWAIKDSKIFLHFKKLNKGGYRSSKHLQSKD